MDQQIISKDVQQRGIAGQNLNVVHCQLTSIDKTQITQRNKDKQSKMNKNDNNDNKMIECNLASAEQKQINNQSIAMLEEQQKLSIQQSPNILNATNKDKYDMIDEKASNNLNNNNGLLPSEFDKKCQIKNELKQQSYQMSESMVNFQKLPSNQFYNKEKSFLFSDFPSDKKLESEAKKDRLEKRESIVTQTPYNTINVGISKHSLRNKLNPSLLYSNKSINEAETFDYMMKVFKDDNSNSRCEDNLSNKIQQQTIPAQIQNDIFAKYLMMPESCLQDSQKREAELCKQVEEEAVQILENIKQKNNSKLIKFLQDIVEESSNDAEDQFSQFDKDVEIKLKVREQNIKQIMLQQQ